MLMFLFVLLLFLLCLLLFFSVDLEHTFYHFHRLQQQFAR